MGSTRNQEMGLGREVGAVRWKMRIGFRWEVDEKRG
jgi:hypothetical protein